MFRIGRLDTESSAMRVSGDMFEHGLCGTGVDGVLVLKG